jgi:hypothetical protein
MTAEYTANVVAPSPFVPRPSDDPPGVCVDIRHSLHEEFIVVTLRLGRLCFELGARSHHAMLLELGRLRLRDRAAEVPVSEEGWTHIEQLARRLDLEPSHINVQVYRVRRQLARAGVPNPGCIIQRRSGCGELRLGFAMIDIDRL